MIKLQCIKCGHIKGCLESDLIQGDTCELCGGLMKVSKKEIVNIVKQDSIDKMKWHLTQMGNNKVWEVIERLIEPKVRLSYRRIFLNAGGVIPKSEV